MPSTGYSVSGNTVTVTNTETGIFHFQSINISTNWTVKFTRNTLNTPVFLLAQSNVTISGTIDVSGANASGSSNPGAAGGPGGYDGASSGASDQARGFGPGGSVGVNYAGHMFVGFNSGGVEDGDGRPYGAAVPDILPMIGGSGGGGTTNPNQPGSGGGGAILIASSMTQTITGSIYANAGSSPAGGAGSGGSVRLIAQTLTGDGTIQALGNFGGIGTGFKSSVGRIRIEGCTLLRAPFSDPTATIGFPGQVFVSNAPTIQITSVAGQTIPAPPTNSFTNPDVSGINEGTINISVLSSNITPGTEFRVIITPEYGGNIVSNGTLSGMYTASTGTVSMSHYSNRAWRVNALIDYIPRP
jgi:hypothetical protein